MRTRTGLWVGMLPWLAPGMLVSAAASPDSVAVLQDPLIQRAVAYRRASDAGQDNIADAMFAADSRVWYEKKEGPGEKRGPSGSGSWAAWDRFFRSKSTDVSYTRQANSVTVVVLETNDFYRLIDRPPSKVSLTYDFDAEGKITGTLVAAVRQEPAVQDRLAEFKAWARDNRPETFEYLMPEGKIVPDQARAEKWRAVLVEWRAAQGLPVVE